MPAPYSDNLYSDPDPAVSESHGVRDDDETSSVAAAASALSPSDGYFHASADDDASPTSRQPQQLHHHQQPTHPSHRSSASGPYVPNVLVEDPTLYSDPDTKAKLAHHLINNDASPAPSSSSPHPHPHHNPQSYYPSASPSVSGASIATPSTITTASYTQLPGRQPQSPRQFSSQNRQLHINTSPPLQPSNYNNQNFNGQADAPPAYTPSSPDNNPSHYNYSTFPSVTSPRMGVPEEHDRLLSPQQQQPFADPPKQPLWRRIKDSHDSGSLRHRIKRILGILVFVSIILVFLGFNMSGPEYRKHIIDKSPIRIPDMSGRDLEWHPNKSCRDTPLSSPKQTFHADLASNRVLIIEQTIQKKGWKSPSSPIPHVDGEVILRPTSASKAALEVEIIKNYEDLDIEVEFDTSGHTDHLKLTTPRQSPDFSRDACIQIRVTAWIPQKAIVNALAVNTISLNLFVQEGLAMGAENSVDFTTVSGNVILPDDGKVEPYKIESPIYKYTTVSGDIKGWFPMYHKLKLNTVSGDVRAQVKHKDIVLSSNVPSLLEAASVSGTVTVQDGSDVADYDVPARDHLVKLTTTSGDIAAKVYTGSSSEFSSTSGDLQIELVPVLDERWLRSSWRPLLKTSTTSGSHRITIKEPLFVEIPNELYPGRRPNLPKTEPPEEPSKANMEGTSVVADAKEDETETQDIKRRRVAKNNRGLTALESRHASISGNMRLFYPASWEGSFSASSMSSDISFRGKDVVVEKKRGGLINKEVSGHKGDGSSTLQIDELSGDVMVWIGL